MRGGATLRSFPFHTIFDPVRSTFRSSPPSWDITAKKMKTDTIDPVLYLRTTCGAGVESKDSFDPWA